MRETLQDLAVIHEKMVFCKDVELKRIATGIAGFVGLRYCSIRSFERLIRPLCILIRLITHPDTFETYCNTSRTYSNTYATCSNTSATYLNT